MTGPGGGRADSRYCGGHLPDVRLARRRRAHQPQLGRVDGYVHVKPLSVEHVYCGAQLSHGGLNDPRILDVLTEVEQRGADPIGARGPGSRGHRTSIRSAHKTGGESGLKCLPFHQFRRSP